MVEIIPAIIPKSFEDLTSEMSRVRGIVSLVQVDIMDSSYAPGRTWPYIKKSDSDFMKIVSQEIGFPFWEGIDFEADMMVANPERIIDDWISAGAKALIIHIETTKEIERIIKKCRDTEVKIGLALKPSTPTSLVEPYVSDIDFVQFMGNDNIGHHGIELDPSVPEKIRDFKKKFPNAIAGVDIGVDFETAPILLKAGAVRLVSGSSIFEAGDIREAITELQNSNMVE